MPAWKKFTLTLKLSVGNLTQANPLVRNRKIETPETTPLRPGTSLPDQRNSPGGVALFHLEATPCQRRRTAFGTLTPIPSR